MTTTETEPTHHTAADRLEQLRTDLRNMDRRTALSRELQPGSDTRIRTAANALSRDLRGVWSIVRELQWEDLSPAGPIFVMPECYRHALALDLAGAGR